MVPGNEKFKICLSFINLHSIICKLKQFIAEYYHHFPVGRLPKCDVKNLLRLFVYYTNIDFDEHRV